MQKKYSITIPSILCFLFILQNWIPSVALAENATNTMQNNTVVTNIQQENLSKEEKDRIVMINRVRKSVVSIIATSSQEDLSRYLELLSVETASSTHASTTPLLAEGEGVTHGSGFFVDQGLLMTNKHVVDNKKLFYGAVDDAGTIYSVEKISTDPMNDIAILKVQSSKKMPLPLPLESLPPQIGQDTLSIGNSLGKYRQSIGTGIISGVKRYLYAFDANNVSERLFDMLQTTAAISQGNSGGPLLASNGRVLGMNTAFDPQGASIGFAIPSKHLRIVLNAYTLLGYIPRPFLGVRYIPLDQDSAKKFKTKSTYGALITSEAMEEAVLKDSPAEKAGLQKGDIILSVQGELLRGEKTLSDVLSLYRKEETLQLIVLRGDKKLRMSLQPKNIQE